MGAKHTTVIPKAAVGRILFKAGAKRVSQSAVDEFATVLMNMAEQIATQSAKIAQHAGRKTIHEGDIRIAAKQ